MTCGKKHCDNNPTEATRVEHTEVEGLLRCRLPRCNCRVIGNECTAGHIQQAAAFAERCEAQLARVQELRAVVLARPLHIRRPKSDTWQNEAQEALELAEVADSPALVGRAWAEKVRSMNPFDVDSLVPLQVLQSALRQAHETITAQRETGTPPEPTGEGVPITRVLNLATGAEQTYFCAPEQAVVAAYEQERDNWNTWEYPPFIDHPERGLGSVTVACGDFTALRSSTQRLVSTARGLHLLQTLHDQWRQHLHAQPIDQVALRAAEAKLMAALSDPVVVPPLRAALSRAVTAALAQSHQAWEVENTGGANLPAATEERRRYQNQAGYLAELHGGTEVLAQVEQWERQMEAASGHCPDCHQELNSFSGNAGIPACRYCPHCLDVAYAEDGTEIGTWN